MERIYKYPRTPHITGSRLQQGDEDLKTVNFENIKGKTLVIEEKLDGANCGISFDKDGNLLLQSRGHYLTGGYRERHFNLFKTWAGVYSADMYQVLTNRYVMYGEWLYAKHTVYYDNLPHYFFEFDILDLKEGEFLSTERRQDLLKELPFIRSVPVLRTGQFEKVEQMTALLSHSLYKTTNWQNHLQETCQKEGISYETALAQTDVSDFAEGLYLKWEEDGIVKGRYKYVRKGFLQQLLAGEGHWLERPIIPNGLEGDELKWI